MCRKSPPDEVAIWIDRGDRSVGRSLANKVRQVIDDRGLCDRCLTAMDTVGSDYVCPACGHTVPVGMEGECTADD